MSRRACLSGLLALAGAYVWPGGVRSGAASQAPVSAGPPLASVTGPLALDELGVTLMHEHVLVDFVGAADVSPSRYDVDEVFEHVLPYLEQAKALGCRTLLECTPAYLGRDPRLLRRLADASGIQILTNTGYYGAAKDKFVPAHAFREAAAELADRWVREWQDGIDGTGIRPAFMKIGVDEGPLSPIDAKLVQAAALTHRATGMTIASHTGNGVAAFEQLDLLERTGVPTSAFIWVHAQSEKNATFHVGAGRRGAWVEFDGVAPKTVERHVALVSRMKTEGLLDRVLVSHDAGWYRVGEAGGGEFRPFDTLFTTFVPALEAAGFTRADVQRLLVENPRAALARAL